MLNLLESFEKGCTTPTSYMRSIITHHISKMDLNPKHCVETSGHPVTCLDIDRIDNTYLLSGYNNGSVSLSKLHRQPNPENYTCEVIASSNFEESHEHSVQSVEWFPFDTGSFTTGGADWKLKIWDTARVRVSETIPIPSKITQHTMSTIATHHSLVAVSMAAYCVLLVDIRTGSRSHFLPGHVGNVYAVQWSPFSGNLLVSGGADNRILLWDIRSANTYLMSLDQYNGEGLSSRNENITAHSGTINGLCFSSDGLYLASFGTDNNIKLWDVASARNTLVNYGRVYNPLKRHAQIDICCDGTKPMLFIPSNKKIEVFELLTGKNVNTLLGHFSVINTCKFRNQYYELYSGGNDGSILIWNSMLDLQDFQEKYLSNLRFPNVWSDNDDTDNDS